MTDSLEKTGVAESSGITWRSIGIGLIGVLFVCGFNPYNKFILENTSLVGDLFGVGGLMVLLLSALVLNTLMRWVMPGKELNKGELAVIICMIWVTSFLAHSGFVRYLPTATVSPVYLFADNQGWESFLEFLPETIFPAKDSNHDMIRKYFLGLHKDEVGSWAAWKGVISFWLVPYTAIAVLIFMFSAGVLALCTVLRRQWMEHEKLTYPIAQIPLAVIEEPEKGKIFNGLFRSKAFWISVILVFGIHLMNGASKYIPGFINLPLQGNLPKGLRVPPFSYMPGLSHIISFPVFFSIIGLSYLLPLEISFSLWFGFIFFQGLGIVYNVFGYPVENTYYNYEVMGGYFFFFLSILYIGRNYYLQVLKGMFKFSKDRPEESAYLLLALISFIGVLAWFVYFGMSPFSAVVFLVLIIVAFLVLARFVAEGVMCLLAWHPHQCMVTLFGTKTIGAKSLTLSAVLYLLLYVDTSEAAMPFATDVYRVRAATPGTRNGRFFILMMIAIVIGLVATVGTNTWAAYSHGAEQFVGRAGLGRAGGTFNFVSRTIEHSKGVDLEAWLHFGIGAVIVTLLSILRLKFVWWPMHPIGFAAGFNYFTGVAWFSIAVGYFAKLMILRYGGVKIYHSSKNFFMGLILGDVIASSFWIIVALIIYFTTGIKPPGIGLFP